MARIATELQCSTIANMLATELKRKGITMAEDEEARYNILYASAESILYGGADKDIHSCVEAIDEYIVETIRNYPNYFITGEEH